MNPNHDILDAPQPKIDRWKLIRRLMLGGVPVFIIGSIFRFLHWPGSIQMQVPSFCWIFGLTLVMAIFGRLKAASLLQYSLSIVICIYSFWLFFIRINNSEVTTRLLEFTGLVFVIGILLMLGSKAHKS